MIDFGPDTVIAIVSIATLIIVVAGGIYWFGKLVNRVDQLENKVDQLSEEIRDMREDIRRGNQQLLLALANHSHDDDGQPVFRVPFGVE